MTSELLNAEKWVLASARKCKMWPFQGASFHGKEGRCSNLKVLSGGEGPKRHLTRVWAPASKSPGGQVAANLSKTLVWPVKTHTFSKLGPLARPVKAVLTRQTYPVGLPAGSTVAPVGSGPPPAPRFCGVRRQTLPSKRQTAEKWGQKSAKCANVAS